MRVTDTLWFTGTHGCVGIVMGVDDTTGEHKAYIGVGVGDSERYDTELLKEHGTPLSLETVLRIASYLGGGKK